MEAQRWRAQQRGLREAVRAARPGGAGLSRLLPDAAPLASVIVVCWNSGTVLGRCLDHLFAQDYANYEVVVVDDGSQDDTLEVAQEASLRGELTIVASSRNRGAPHARNLGLARARGEIVAFIDADGFAAPGWLRELIAAFAGDETIGGVASTVFFDRNPLVVNGAGGIVNRQGWAADLSMNESYERAEIASEALYPMGCGMALRRSAVERVGPFDDRMLNYYDDVDYGVRLWRAGYRVHVAPDAWIDHGFGQGGDQSARKRLLCERHRMRVVLKHAPPGSLGRWTAHEASALKGASPPVRVQKLRATLWNLLRLPSVLASRWRLRGALAVPAVLLDPSWGDAFPAGVPPLSSPHPESADSSIDMAEEQDVGQLPYGWFPAEHVDGRSYRWAGVQAAALIRLEKPARRLRLDYAHVPHDIGGVDVWVRRMGSPDPLAAVWSTRLQWRYLARSVENHPLALAAGDYEVLFSVADGWLEPPLETRSLAFALSKMSFEDSFEIAADGADMSSSAVEEQLVSGWFEAEQSPTRSYRWAAGSAALVVRLAQGAGTVSICYSMPPGPIGGVRVSVRPLGSSEIAWDTRIDWRDGDWHEESFPLRLSAGEHLVTFDADRTWSNRGQQDPSLPPENRSLGFALSSLSFG